MNPLPSFQIDSSEIPVIRLKGIKLENVKAFDCEYFDFIQNNKPIHFKCFHGPNGCGKTTILDAIQLLFANFTGVDKDRLKNRLSKLIRHVSRDENALYNENENFKITGYFTGSIGDYEVVIDRNGYISNHPDKIKSIASRLCFYTRFDQELDIFQLERNQWNIFKDLFESVTGYKIEEMTGIFDQSADPVQAEILKKYVLGFWVKKPDETISYKECSAGEKKTIKCFSTLLNKEIRPQIILVDNIEMHVEMNRHIELVNSMKRCFPDSQIFASTHSYYISRYYKYRSQLFDMRLLKCSDIVKKEPIRLTLCDEIRDVIAKIESVKFDYFDKIGYEKHDSDFLDNIIGYGNCLISQLMKNNDKNFESLKIESLQTAAQIFLNGGMGRFLARLESSFKHIE